MHNRSSVASHFFNALCVLGLVAILALVVEWIYSDDMQRISRNLQRAERTGKCIEVLRETKTGHVLTERFCPSYPTTTPNR